MKTIFRAAAALTTTALLFIGGGPAFAQPPVDPPTETTTTPFTTPNTDDCPYAASPPPAIDLSEVPAPGDPTPDPMPIPAEAVGGDALAACGTITPDGAPPLPADISATGWVLSDLDTGDVIAAKDPHGRYRPASTIKILLALVALEELDPNTTIVATAEDANAEGSAVGIGKGGVYTNFQLMQGLVMASGNDAAHALAAQLGGDAATVDKMNAKAKDLGALDTRAATPSGLDGPGMSSSAYDLALFFRAAMQNPMFAQLISTETVEFPGFPKDPAIPDDQDRPGFALSNDNQLLYNYEGALGGKTGYTDDARQTFVGGAEKNGRRLAVTIMKGDVLPIRPWEQAARLLDYGFATPTGTRVGELVDANSVGTVSSTRPTPTLAAPPGSSTAHAATVDDGDGDNTALRVGIGVVGAIVVIGLLLAARRLNRRP
ncbi:D-alanyl-D-alanine carboxypeptidase family protein [Rhodococcoides kyotonense]|uniref:D-alanyl-D-alanine carboxypeptidase (Penicillin-binding protein 5/6) n=1 Tax=Rhodococcoides kyotonense TaxID=398843 RepID=A0A239NFJ6_9NOCA|nr:D-alanyl-D-alanine carboxypeptidase family protein [Rhodococcus kyotonensis]SNT53174.1 D-alanyl-D-alanine carboxypeptidase (penicillin-binding protein 5/6) [Rhodococcus kyotonensis]